MDPGTIIAVTQVSFKAASLAIEVVGDSLDFFEDSETLAIQLAFARVSLQLWGKNSGLEAGMLPPPLLGAHEAVGRMLELIKTSFEDAQKLCKKYLMATETKSGGGQAASDTTDKMIVAELLKRLQQTLVIKGIGASEGKGYEVDGNGRDKVHDGAKSDALRAHRSNPGIWKRLQWGARDKEKLSQCVTDLRSNIGTLSNLLSESQRQQFRIDNDRVGIVALDSASKPAEVDVLRDAISKDDLDARAMAERKALLGTNVTANATGIRLLDLMLPKDWYNSDRLLVPRKAGQAGLLVLEKRAYDSSISHDDKQILERRIERLVGMLMTTESPSFKTLTAQQHINDPQHFCWWIVFEYKGPAPDRGMSTPALLNLSTLLQPALKFKPPLEHRLRLATSICGTLSSLYSSGWLHKSFRSDNVVFQRCAAPTAGSPPDFGFLASPCVSGFEYSRQESESKSINRAAMLTDLGAAIYRHHSYQGVAAQGYRIEHDIYSVGLVLVEIALWLPLRMFLDVKDSTGVRRFAANLQTFHKAEAAVLQEVILEQVKKELAFKMGTTFRDTVLWCLTLANQMASAGPSPAQGEYPALAFYNNVLVKLRRITTSLSGELST